MSYLAPHYQVLGIPTGSPVEDVKKAYRRKSMQLHPDVNKHPDATAQFVQLNESYEYLLHALTNKIFQPSSGNFVQRKKEDKPMTYAEWQARCREEVQKRAYRQAQEHLNKFKKSSYYRTSYQLGHILFYIVMGMVYIFTFGIPITIMFYNPAAGLIFLLIINFVCLGAHRMIYDTLKEIRREKEYIRKVKEMENKR